jgi:Membrane protein implicated in regulation of membrane protease activity
MWQGSEVFLLLADYMGYVWLVLALLLLFAELSTPGLFFFISFALGAFCSSVLAFLGYSIVVQCWGGLCGAGIAFVLLRMYLKRTKMSKVDYAHGSMNVDALVGRQGLVTGVISPHVPGWVKIGGEIWAARSDVSLQEGTPVIVLRVQGNTVIVKAAKQGD